MVAGYTGAEMRLVDYTLAKRAKLTELRGGRLSRDDVCDAHPSCCGPPATSASRPRRPARSAPPGRWSTSPTCSGTPCARPTAASGPATAWPTCTAPWTRWPATWSRSAPPATGTTWPSATCWAAATWAEIGFWQGLQYHPSAMAAPPITPSRAARHQQPGKPQVRERKQAPPPRRSRLRRILRWALWLAIPAVAVAAGTVIGLIYAFARVPLPAEVPTAQTIVFLDQTGKREIGTLSAQENRRVVSLDKIPVDAQRAVLAAEDRDFYEHGAISYRGLARATAANLLRRRISEGGSTITDRKSTR